MSKGGWIFLAIWCAGSLWNAWVYERQKARLRNQIYRLEVDKILRDQLIRTLNSR